MTLAEPSLREKREARSVTVVDHATNAIEQVLIKGDLKALTPEQRNQYYAALCHATGLNPLTQPFEYLNLQGKLVLYAKKACTDQLRAIHRVSVVDMDQEEREGVYSVTVKVQNGEGRTDMDIGSVKIEGLSGDARANAMMKASTKAKRRATLSICGLGLLDETEVETIPGAPSLAPGAADGAMIPDTPPRQQKVLNPETGRMIDPGCAHQQRKNGVWEQFEEKVRSFTDIDKLESWWKHPRTQAEVDAMPGEWPELAHEEYEKACERVLNAGAPR